LTEGSGRQKEVGPDQNAGLVIAVAIVVDAMANPAK